MVKNETLSPDSGEVRDNTGLATRQVLRTGGSFADISIEAQNIRGVELVEEIAAQDWKEKEAKVRNVKRFALCSEP